MRTGRLQAVAVTTPARAGALPDVPTIAESGLPGFDVTVWYGILAPAGTPAAAIRTLNVEIVSILTLPDVAERLAGLGLDAKSSTPQQFGTILRKEAALWQQVVREAGIKAE